MYKYFVYTLDQILFKKKIEQLIFLSIYNIWR